MNDKRFSRPVAIRMEPSGARLVASAWEALECLSGPWPVVTSHAYRYAFQSCRDALDGLRSAQAAQHAFADAAREAGLLHPAHRHHPPAGPQHSRQLLSAIVASHAALR